MFSRHFSENQVGKGCDKQAMACSEKQKSHADPQESLIWMHEDRLYRQLYNQTAQSSKEQGLTITILE